MVEPGFDTIILRAGDGAIDGRGSRCAAGLPRRRVDEIALDGA